MTFRSYLVCTFLSWSLTCCIVLQVPGKDAMISNDKFYFVPAQQSLSKRPITSFAQDKYGFLWIGTFGSGLFRFDGLDYINYNYIHEHENTISSNVIYETLIDSDGKIWLATDNGVSVFDPLEQKFSNIDIATTSGRNDITILGICFDSFGNTLISTGSEGLFIYKKSTKSTQKITFESVSDEQLFVWDMKMLPDNSILLGTNYGLLTVNYAEMKIIPRVFETGDSTFIIEEIIETIYVDSEQNIWAGTRNAGVYQLTRNVIKNKADWALGHYTISSKRILSFVEKSKNQMLVGTENDGLWLLDFNGNVIDKFLYSKYSGEEILSNSIWSLFRDQDDRIWIGYYDKGIAVYDPLYDKFQHLKSTAYKDNSLQVGSVTAIEQDSFGRYWLGMEGGGIDIYDANNDKFEHCSGIHSQYTGLTNLAIQALKFDSKGNLWVGSWDGGLFLLKKGSKNFINFTVENTNGGLASDRIMSIDEDKNGIIWLGSFRRGLFSYNPESESFTSYNSVVFKGQDFRSDVRRVFIDSKNEIWIGTTQGLYKISFDKPDEPRLISLASHMSKGLVDHSSINLILSIEEDAAGNIWIGTDGGGLCQYNRLSDQFTWYNLKSGFPAMAICSILDDMNGNIWVSSKSGIAQLNVQTGNTSLYTVQDGLLSNAYNFNAAFRNKNGQLFFGNYLGVDFFEPSELRTNQIKPKTYLTRLRLFNSEVHPGDPTGILDRPFEQTKLITLTHEQSVISIDFVGLNYTRPENNAYAFYLEGLEQEWNYVGNTNSATYTSLKNGSYVFRVKSANNDGLWSDAVRELNIIVLPPWWRSKWALAAYVIIFILLLYFFVKIVQIRARDKQTFINEIEKRRQEEELHDRKLQFFTNISHEFKTPLTLILNPLKDVLSDKSLSLPRYVLEKLHVMHKNSDRLQRLINELMDFRKLKHQKLPLRAREIDFESFVRSVCQYFEQEALAKNIIFEVLPNPTERYIWVDQDMLEKIIFNLLSNAFKVTPENGSIQVLTGIEQHQYGQGDEVDSIKLTIIDTGMGLAEDQLEKIFDRFYQVDQKSKDYFGGTGIGLEVVKDFMTLNKGEIEVKSQVGSGTSFELYFRLGDEHLSNTEKLGPSALELRDAIIPPEAVFTDEGQKPSRYSVLVVEDNLELKQYLHKELNHHFKVNTASEGHEALEKALNEQPDAVVTDVMMPGINGVELCQRLKKDIKTSHIPVIMLTAKSSIDDQLDGLSSGADAYIAKPFDIRLLVSQLNQILESRELLFEKYFKGIVHDKRPTNQVDSGLMDKDFIERLMRYLNDNIAKSDLSVEALADELHLSRSQLYRKVKALTGVSVNEFTRQIRLEKAKRSIENGNYNISDVSYSVGFASPSYFTKCFKEYFGYLPKDVIGKA